MDPAGDAAVAQALATAYGLYRNRDAWLSPAKRIDVLECSAAIMSGRKEMLALEAAREGGKPLIDSRVEVARAIEGHKVCVATLRTAAGEVIPMDMNAASAGRLAFTRKEPIGIVVAVSAFNHPLNLIVHQVGPAGGGRLPGDRKAGRRHAAVLFSLCLDLVRGGATRSLVPSAGGARS